MLAAEEPATTINPFKRAAQLEKARVLMRLFHRFRYTYAHVSKMNHKDWALVAYAAGVNMPSREVRELVLTNLLEKQWDREGKENTE